MHNSRSDSNFFYKCLKPKCHATFQKDSEMKTHLRIHDNDFETCQYCPFKYIRKSDYRHHLNKHFGIKEFKCDQCGKLFVSKPHLKKHYAVHEGIIYHCLLCEGYEGSCQNATRAHLLRRHSELVGKYFTWESVEKFVKITK